MSHERGTNQLSFLCDPSLDFTPFLGDIKAALTRMPDNPTAARMVGEVDKLLETMFASSRFV